MRLFKEACTQAFCPGQRTRRPHRATAMPMHDRCRAGALAATARSSLNPSREYRCHTF